MLMMEYFPIFSGHAVYLQYLISRLKDFDCDVSILTPDYYEYPSFEIINDIRVNRIGFDYSDKRWELKFTLNVLAYLLKNLKSYDILHINGHLDIYGFFTLFNKLLRKHTISQMVLLGSDDPMSVMKQYKLMNIRFKILSLMDQFLCISRPIADSYQKAGLPMKKLTYIPQGVDVDKFRPIENLNEKEALKIQLGLNHYKKIVIFIGAIVKRKGIDLLLEAWGKIQSKHPDSLLLLVGQDTFTSKDINKLELENFVSEMKNVVSSKNYDVIFTGKKDNVEQYLKCSDVFVLPSRNEGFGNVILEAMSCGLPVVVTEMDGVSRETVIHGENGFIVDSPQELADSIINLLNHPHLAAKQGEVGHQRAINEFSMVKIAERYSELYHNLL
jgi:glycosyltransferase involved in cell wall biosynthesis